MKLENKVLVVSEDPYFIDEANAVLRCVGARTIGCLGPAHTDCDLYVEGFCPLAGSADFVIVDSPTSGRFTYHSVEIPSGEYAEALQRRYPGAFVVLCGAPVGASGPTGETAVAADRNRALFVLTRILRNVDSKRGLATAGSSAR